MKANRLILFFLRSHTHTHTEDSRSVANNLSYPVMFDFEKLDVTKGKGIQFPVFENLSRIQGYKKQSECERG